MKKKFAISVLLPTRGRTESLEKSIRSLLDLAADPAKIEILLAVDRDDQATIDFTTNQLKSILENRYKCGYTVMAFNPIGYIRLNEYLNALAKVSTGDWLFFYNDDAVMTTQNWDNEILIHTGKTCLLRAETNNQHPYAIFPILPRSWIEVTGHISAHQINDAWVSHIAYMLDIVIDIPVYIRHERFDLTGLNNDDTYKNRPMLEGNANDPKDFNHVIWREIRLKETLKLCEFIERKENRICQWFRDGSTGKINIWEKMIAADKKNRLTTVESQ